MTAWAFDPLVRRGYGAILVDSPTWFRSFSRGGSDKSAEQHYPTMTLADIAALPVGELADDDCALFLWATWPLLPEMILLMQGWGFDYKTGGSWTKLTRDGRPHFGTGYIWRSACEPILIGTRGRPNWRGTSVRNVIEAPRREHSRKPPEMRQTIETMLPHARACELFAREPWAGHDVWGNEVDRFADDQKAPNG